MFITVVCGQEDDDKKFNVPYAIFDEEIDFPEGSLGKRSIYKKLKELTELKKLHQLDSVLIRTRDSFILDMLGSMIEDEIIPRENVVVILLDGPATSKYYFDKEGCLDKGEDGSYWPYGALDIWKD